MNVTNARILVVDDEPQIRRVMRATLVARGYMVSTARNGEEALDKVREERFDLVLLDINMPGIGGMEDVPHHSLAKRHPHCDSVHSQFGKRES